MAGGVTRAGWQRNVSIVMAHVTAIAIVAGGANFRHFTWCYITLFLMLMFMHRIGFSHYWFWFFMSLSFVVVVSVVTMSLKGCRVFERAYSKNGPLGFIPGNFGMHMFPAVVAYALATHYDVYCGRESVIIQCSMALAVSLIWLHFEDPMQVYECSLPSIIGLSGFVVGAFCVMLLGLTLQHSTLRRYGLPETVNKVSQ